MKKSKIWNFLKHEIVVKKVVGLELIDAFFGSVAFALIFYICLKDESINRILEVIHDSDATPINKTLIIFPIILVLCLIVKITEISFLYFKEKEEKNNKNK